MKRILIILILGIIFSCNKDDNPSEDNTPTILSSEKKIESFIIDGIETNISESDSTISIITNANQTNFFFSPIITVSSKATVSPTSGTSIDLSNETEFTVTAENNSKKVYTSNLVRTSGLKSIKLEIQNGAWEIDGLVNETNQTISFDYPESQVGSTPYLEIEFFGNMTSSIPESNVVINIETLNELQLSFPEGTKTYSLKFRNTENRIFCFSLEIPRIANCGSFDADGTYDEYRSGLEDKDKVFFTLEDIDITSLKPDMITLSSGATISPDPETIQNFTNDVTYVVTSESGEAKNRTIRLIKKKIIIVNGFSQGTSTSISATNPSFQMIYYSINKIANAEVINIVNPDEIIPCEIPSDTYVDSSTQSRITLRLSTMPIVGERYFVRLGFEDGSSIDTKFIVSIN